MNTKQSTLAIPLGLGLFLAGAATAETIVLAEPEVRTIVTTAGYAEPIVIKRDDTLWRVRSVGPSGDEVTVFVNAEGKVLGASEVVRTGLVTTTTTTTRVANRPLNEGEVATVLVDAGFHNVHDVDFRNGIWKAEADDVTGEDFEIHVHPTTGAIVHIEDD